MPTSQGGGDTQELGEAGRGLPWSLRGWGLLIMAAIRNSIRVPGCLVEPVVSSRWVAGHLSAEARHKSLVVRVCSLARGVCHRHVQYRCLGSPAGAWLVTSDF